MVRIYFLVFLISNLLIKLSLQYIASGGFCSAQGFQQSPVNIVSTQSAYYDEKYFRILTNQYNNLDTNNTWSIDTNANAIGVIPHAGQANFGNLIFIKDWGFTSLVLQRIHLRVGSQNSIDGRSYAAELELIHTVDANYYSPGKRVDLGVNYVVISIPFIQTLDSDPQASSLFQWMNLQGFANKTSPNMTRPIKLYSIVQHQPAYLYQGTLPYGDCQPALYIQFTQYHLIKTTDYKNLVTASSSLLDTSNNLNVRSTQQLTTTVYRNFDNTTKLSPNLNLISFQNSNYSNVNINLLLYLSIVIFLF